MDSITHIVLGATMGQAMAGSKLNKKSMLLGAIAQSIPDIDFITSFWSDPPTDILAHRGFTHSLLFAFLLTPLLAWGFSKWDKSSTYSFRDWNLFFGIGILMHLFIDIFNAYGTGLFEPFSHARVSFHTLFVADPLFTVWVALSSVALLFRWKNKRWRFAWTLVGLGMSGLYLTLAVAFKLIVTDHVETQLMQQSIHARRLFVTPTPLNSLLWYAVAEDENGFHVGYRSILDKQDKIEFQFFNKNDSLLNHLRERDDVVKLIRFSQGYYLMTNPGDTLTFNDLRFGQMAGWKNRQAGFVFHYYLNDPDGNNLIIQRGRVSFWNRKALKDFWARIRGT